jgi:hypothetical protein
MKKALVFVGYQQKGFLSSIGNVLSTKFGYNVVFVAVDKYVAYHLRENSPNIEIEIQPNFSLEKENPNAIKLSLFYEEKYKKRFSILCSFDRALGYGYLNNIDQYPSIKRAKWSQERKYSVLISQFKYLEDIFKKHSPSLVLQELINPITFLVTSMEKIPYFGLGSIKYGDKKFWYDKPEYYSSNQKELLNKYLSKCVNCDAIEDSFYKQESGSYYINSKLKFDYTSATKGLLRYILIETYKLIKGTHKKESYNYLGWWKKFYRKVNRYRYLEKYGKKINDLKGKKIVYFPLHLEPEVALLWISPEFSNSVEMITWISKSLPADTVLVVKEHLTCLGIRSKSYYDKLRMLPNVVLAHPIVESWAWIKTSIFVTTITGTVSVEAVYFKKPVLSFGASQVINILPTVKPATDYKSTSIAVNDILAGFSNSQLEHSARVMNMMQEHISFSLIGYDNSYSNTSPEDGMAKIALDKLFSEHNFL